MPFEKDRLKSRKDGNQPRKNGSQNRSKIKNIPEKMDGGQEEMKAPVGSLASWINANQEEMSQSNSH
jgi:hypothetical protein